MFLWFGHVGAKTTARDQGVFGLGQLGLNLCFSWSTSYDSGLLLMTVYLLLGSKSNFRTQHQLRVRTHPVKNICVYSFFYCFGHVGARATARDQGVLFGNVGSEFVLLWCF